MLEPAPLAFDATGTPYSERYGDVYHSADSGPGQSRHVFLGGNDLPARWAGARAFTIVETGFGLGLNFLATWQAWQSDPAHGACLHFVSIEKHPYARTSLASLHERYPEFAALAAQLQAAWPPPVPGIHRLHFDAGRVTLTLALGDVAAVFPQLRCGADAFYLDGFAPARNGDMWRPRIMMELGRLARPGATLATYTTARAVRDALAAAGFVAEKRAGFGRKREMLAARYAPHRVVRHAAPPAASWIERRAIVIGAGLAGAAVSERLAARGWRIDLIERHAAPAAEGSGMHAGAFRPHVSRDDSVLSRLTRAGFLYALDHWRALQAAGQQLEWQCCGVLQIAADTDEETRMRATVAALGLPAGFVTYLPCDAAELRAGCRLAAGGWWFPDGGWMQPARLAAAQIAAARGLTAHFGKTVDQLSRDAAGRQPRWHALAADGSEIASAPVVVLANSHDAARLADFAAPLKSVRGQVTYVPAHRMPALRAVLTGPGYVLPPIDGIAVAGASYEFDDDDPAPRAPGHVHNLARLARVLPAAIDDLDPQSLGGGVGFRCVAVDRLPLIGALPDVAAARARGAALSGAHAADLPRLPGLYGALAYASRGLVWAALGGELVASLIEGEPLPLTADLADAVDPGRFALKRARRGML